MKWAITIGAYKLFDFVALNVCRCRVIFGDDVAILIDDDKSENSDRIREIAEKYDCSYVCSKMRRGHFSGDITTFINTLVFGKQVGCDIALKLSQRVVPVLPSFREAFEKAFANPQIQIVLPGKIGNNQIARPSARFFQLFGILTDVAAFRNGAIEPEELVSIYRERFTTGKNHADALVETLFGHLLATKFKDSAVVLPELANYQPFKPKPYLRKSQCLEREYQALADMHGLTGSWDVRDWGLIERQGYLCRPLCV